MPPRASADGSGRTQVSSKCTRFGPVETNDCKPSSEGFPRNSRRRSRSRIMETRPTSRSRRSVPLGRSGAASRWPCASCRRTWQVPTNVHKRVLLGLAAITRTPKALKESGLFGGGDGDLNVAESLGRPPMTRSLDLQGFSCRLALSQIELKPYKVKVAGSIPASPISLYPLSHESDKVLAARIDCDAFRVGEIGG
jgi:hypothetical protein